VEDYAKGIRIFGRSCHVYAVSEGESFDVGFGEPRRFCRGYGGHAEAAKTPLVQGICLLWYSRRVVAVIWRLPVQFSLQFGGQDVKHSSSSEIPAYAESRAKNSRGVHP